MVRLKRKSWPAITVAALLISGLPLVSPASSATKSSVNTLIIKRDYKAAFAQVSAQAKAGDANAQYRLATFYRLGLGTKVDLTTAQGWLTKAAAGGSAKASALSKKMAGDIPPTPLKSVEGGMTKMAGEVNFAGLPQRASGQASWLSLAAARKKVDVVNVLAAQKATDGENLAILAAARIGDAVTVQALAAQHVMSSADARGQTALMVAVSSGNAALVDALLSSKVDLLAQDKSGQNAVALAAQECNAALVSKLLAAGATLDEKSTPLIAVAEHCSNWPDFTTIFAKANVNAVNGLGRSAAWYAAQKGDVSLLSWLVDKGADLSLPDKNGLSPLHNAALNKQVFALRFLLSKQIKADVLTVKGTSPLMLAAFSGCTECATPLLDKAADVDLKNEDGDTALMFALRGGHTDVAALLVQHGANPAARNLGGESPLKLAEKLGMTVAGLEK